MINNDRIMKKFVVSLAVLILLGSLSFGQTRTIHGRLTTFNTFALSNVEVNAKQAKSSVVTDSLGCFALECSTKDIIRITPKAFRPYSRRVNEDTDTLVINLVFIDSKSNRQMATGFGYISEENLSFAANHLEHQNNDFCNYNSVYELIEGRFPGVIVETDGRSGSIYIRGSRSAGASNRALTVVDGLITGGLGSINPCDVRSIDIIKDGMTAMYGSEGGNGVVVIETIRGTEHSR